MRTVSKSMRVAAEHGRAKGLWLRSAVWCSALLGFMLLASCSHGLDTVYIYENPVLATLGPDTLVPGTLIRVSGRNFVPEEIGTMCLRLRGTFGGEAAEVSLPLRFVDYQHAEASFHGALAVGFPGHEGIFEGEASVVIENMADRLTHASLPLPVALDVRALLTPKLLSVATGPIFVNDSIPITGEGFLLGGEEGTTVAVISGCLRPEGAPSCSPLDPVEVPLAPAAGTSRQEGAFVFEPRIAGIAPGTLENAVVWLRNHHGSFAGNATMESGTLTASWEIQRPTIFRVTPDAASLGQYVDIEGGGFTGKPAGSSEPGTFTTFDVAGTFTPEGASSGTSVSLTLIGEWVSGRLVRYVLNEQDELGTIADLRHMTGRFAGTIAPVVAFAGETVRGDAVSFSFTIAPVKQVIWLNFQNSYVESLRHFGLRAVEPEIRARILEVAVRDYQGINVEFRTERPTDFALYSEVDIQGPDPNRLGLLGYDNTPGKDVENMRLYDKIGGDNALTREDGYPGYGGVFVESFFGFSLHPGSFATKLPSATKTFDDLFDPFRPDRGGTPVRAEDLADGLVPKLTSGSGCPAPKGDRPMQIACAIWALGSMIGTTMTHEIGHSLGLADPYGTNFHNPGDEPNRLMDAGSARTFNERAELYGEGPAVFCDEEYEYLRSILPSKEPPPDVLRPPCY